HAWIFIDLIGRREIPVTDADEPVVLDPGNRCPSELRTAQISEITCIKQRQGSHAVDAKSSDDADDTPIPRTGPGSEEGNREDQCSKAKQDPCTRSGGEKYEKEKEHRQKGPQPGAIERGQVDQEWQRRVDERRQMVPVGEEARMDGEWEQFTDGNPRGGRILN